MTIPANMPAILREAWLMVACSWQRDRTCRAGEKCDYCADRRARNKLKARRRKLRSRGLQAGF